MSQRSWQARRSQQRSGGLSVIASSVVVLAVTWFTPIATALPVPGNASDGHARAAASSRDVSMPWRTHLGLASRSSREPRGARPDLATSVCDWRTLIPATDPSDGAAPHGRLGHTAIVDEPRQRAVFFGGDGDQGAIAFATRNDSWSLSLGHSAAWSELHPTGVMPPGRRAHTAIFDAPRDRMIVFGGIGFDTNRIAMWPDDSATVWSLALDGTPHWSVLQAPPATMTRRFAHASAYDPTRGRMWVYGGSREIGSLNFSDQLDVLDLAGPPAWSGIATAGSRPPGLAEHIMVYDSARDRILLFGGIRAHSAAPMREVWQLNLAGSPAWSQLAVIGTPPSETTQIRGVYDPLGDQLIIVGPSEVQALTLAGAPAWRPARAHPTRYGPAVARDSAGSRILAMGGEIDGAFVNDALEMTPQPTVAWSVTPKDAGTVTLEYHGDCPDTVSLTALPVHGYDFSAWSGDASGATNPVTVDLMSQRNVIAHFTVSTATLVSRFEATRTVQGVELRWGFGDPGRVTSTSIERKHADEAAWQPLSLTVLAERGDLVALDTEASAAREYDYRLHVALWTGETIVVGPVRATASAIPALTTITAISPNPSAGRVTIAFTIGRAGVTTLAILDVAGRHLCQLVSARHSPGTYYVSWDGTAAGRRLPDGLYFARLSCADRSTVRRLALSR